MELTFENVGSMPKQAMGHNVVILKPGIKCAEFGPKTIPGGTLENGFLPEAVMGDVLHHTKLLGPGE